MTNKKQENQEPISDSLPLDLVDGELVTIAECSAVSRKTKKPNLYTEGSLLDDMKAASKFVENDEALRKQLKEISGLGTAATRDSIIEGLKNDRYIQISGKSIVATDKGKSFIRWLRDIAPDTVNVALTARWEAELSLVAQNGGGADFEARVQAFVKDLVATLKDAPPLRAISSSTKETEKTSMSETPEKRSSEPTPKMLEFAKGIAKTLGLRVPDDVMVDFEACKAFIDANKDRANAPSAKQLEFAKSIATRKKVQIPAEVLADRRAISKWIDENIN